MADRAMRTPKSVSFPAVLFFVDIHDEEIVTFALVLIAMSAMSFDASSDDMSFEMSSILMLPLTNFHAVSPSAETTARMNSSLNSSHTCSDLLSSNFSIRANAVPSIIHAITSLSGKPLFAGTTARAFAERLE